MRTRYRKKTEGQGSVSQAARGAALIILFALAVRFAAAAGQNDRIPLVLKLSLMHELPEYDYASGAEIPEFAPPDMEQTGQTGEKATDFEPVGYINLYDEWENELSGEDTLEQPGEPSELPLKAISIAPASASGYLEAAEGVLVKNSTELDVDVEYLLNRPLPYNLTSKGAQVLIIHTHGSEAYTEPGKTTYNPAIEQNRSQDNEKNVVRVGAEIASIIENAGIEVVHDKNLYDIADFNKSYEAALEGIRQRLKENPSIKVVIDIHRDAMITAEGVKYKPVANVQGVECAQVMLVMGTGQNGLSHEYWKENLKLALRLQKTMNTDYPGIARPIDLRDERFNQHATMGSMLVEIGSSGNTLEEALAGARCFAWALCKELNRIKK